MKKVSLTQITPNLPIEFFVPMVQEVFSRILYDKSVVDGKPVPLKNQDLARQRLIENR